MNSHPTQLLGTRTQVLLAACDAVGLSFWCIAPMSGYVWAVDDDQRAHLVRIHYKAHTARHACIASEAYGAELEQCPGADEAVPFTVPSDEEAFLPLDSENL